ncbi:MAG: hypothetical protein PUB00_05675 [Clostridiales bacterium]|nr:hypothetical protein [Clostridiales bacterium]
MPRTACWKQACAEVIVTAPESAGKAVVIVAAFNRDGVAIVNRLSSGGCFPASWVEPWSSMLHPCLWIGMGHFL